MSKSTLKRILFIPRKLQPNTRYSLLSNEACHDKESEIKLHRQRDR